MEQVRIGILGAARIAPMALIAPAKRVSEAQVAAVAARDPHRALSTKGDRLAFPTPSDRVHRVPAPRSFGGCARSAGKTMTDRQQIATDWASRGFSCDLWTDPPGPRV
jgi:hypothetical protein